jgi:integrase
MALHLKPDRFVAYYRVSTAQQGRSGLGLEAQREAVRVFLEINDGVDVRLVQEFLGHASITSTAIYTAISPKRLAGLRVR